MDANAYLKRHGWRGDGHSLDTTNRGIRKPLLVSKKIDVLGVGLNKHAAVSDQWWMRAFDEGLKSLGTDKKSTLSTVRTHGIHLGGLYGRFVKGETVEGTIGSGSTSEDDKVKALGGEVLGKKRKREDASEEKSSKRKLDGSSGKAQKLRRDIDRKIKVVVSEAKQSGLISNSSSIKKLSARSSAKVDEATLVHIFEQAGLPASTMPEDEEQEEEAGKKSSKAQKYTREKSQRELKRAAQAYFESQLSKSDLQALRDDLKAKEKQHAAKGDEKAVDKYKRKAEKSIARAAKAERKKKKAEHKAELRSNGGDVPAGTVGSVDALQLAKYQERAAAKGISVEKYIQQKERKAAKTQTRNSDQDTNEPTTKDLGFVVDTAGDPSLVKATETPVPGKKSLHVVDAHGHIRYTIKPDEPVPLDPTIWEGVDIKTLPKAIREARKAWMAERRESRKVGKPGHKLSSDVHKDKAQRRDLERKEHAQELLKLSRKALKDGKAGGKIDLRFPLIDVTTTKGAFSKEESALARKTVRSTLKKEKKAAQADSASTKKSKKDRAAK